MKIQIYNKNFDLSDHFQKYLEDKFSTLDKYQEDILSFQVNLSRDQHHNKGEVYNIDVKIDLPKKKTILASESDTDPMSAVDSALDKLTRQLLKYKDKKTDRFRKKIKYFKSLKFWKKKEE